MEMLKQLIMSIATVVKDWTVAQWLAHAFGIELY